MEDTTHYTAVDASTPLRRRVRAVQRVLTGPGSVFDLLPRAADATHPADAREATGLYRRLLADELTMVSARRARALHRAARSAAREGVPGALVDCGVWNGGSTVMLSRGAPDREVWAFDSFEGLPEPSPEDGESSTGYGGDCLGSEAKLREAFRRYAHPERLHVVRGWFEDTFVPAKEEIGPIAVLHADGDWYESVRLTLATFYDQVSPGGYVLIDDYGHWEGARRAVDEFRAAVGAAEPMRSSDYSGRWWRKA
jgi:O-methyltransferase